MDELMCGNQWINGEHVNVFKNGVGTVGTVQNQARLQSCVDFVGSLMSMSYPACQYRCKANFGASHELPVFPSPLSSICGMYAFQVLQ